MKDVMEFLDAALEVSPEATVHDTVRDMSERQIGVAAVIQNCRIIGIVTERDLVRRAAPLGPEGNALLVREAMTQPVECVPAPTPAVDAVNRMREKRIRHLGIVDGNGCYLGMVSLRRLAFEVMDELELKVDNLTRELMADGPGG
jgi:CBS domain-containing protein